MIQVLASYDAITLTRVVIATSVVHRSLCLFRRRLYRSSHITPLPTLVFPGGFSQVFKLHRSTPGVRETGRSPEKRRRRRHRSTMQSECAASWRQLRTSRIRCHYRKQTRVRARSAVYPHPRHRIQWNDAGPISPLSRRVPLSPRKVARGKQGNIPPKGRWEGAWGHWRWWASQPPWLGSSSAPLGTARLVFVDRSLIRRDSAD